MATPSPAPWIYEGEGVMRAASSYFAARADKDFTPGNKYLLVEHQERSVNSHNQQFAWLTEAWQNLPEHLAELYPSPEHLRKRALIDAGYYHETAIDCGSRAAALRVATFIRNDDPFKLVVVRGPIVLARTAMSQTYRAMDRKTFQASKAAIMNIIEDLIGVERGSLEARAEKAA